MIHNLVNHQKKKTTCHGDTPVVPGIVYSPNLENVSRAVYTCLPDTGTGFAFFFVLFFVFYTLVSGNTGQGKTDYDDKTQA
ncbi:MAG: hypothetical protein BWY09_02603 [Candidatus Hydrogenedentes bacterium ADurb.Bin179]|nr:MAG: hypothetical protein BWY09_02603 [Candidatus Hydrogenedentes bacterium ADurb.Bin179]